MQEKLKDKLKKQSYGIVGKHSGVKVCKWCKESLRGNEKCYKSTFYGINSERCVQMTPSLQFCSENCKFCWRSIRFKMNDVEWEAPEKIIDECIEKHKELLQGFKGNPLVSSKLFERAVKPKHFAISLSGEPTLYPYLPDLIKILHERKLTSFLVTNGTFPGMLEKLLKVPLTQLYVTLPSPNKELYREICNPIVPEAWEKLIESLLLLKNFKRSVVRLTMVKGLNMVKPGKYANLLETANPDFIEVKGFVSVGGARKRLGIEYMPSHREIKEFSKRLEELTNYSIKNEREESRVVLLKGKTKVKNRIEI